MTTALTRGLADFRMIGDTGLVLDRMSPVGLEGWGSNVLGVAVLGGTLVQEVDVYHSLDTAA